MKFGESLSEGLVQEWKDQYVNYKQGKDKIKRISRLMAQVDADTVPSDTTPLLEPHDESIVYVPDLNGLRSHGDRGDHGGDTPSVADTEAKSRSSRRRPSVFGFGSRVVSDNIRAEKHEFSEWIDHELARVEAFYREKEKDVYYRFLILEDQFHQLREHRMANLQRNRNLENGNRHNDVSHPSIRRGRRWNKFWSRYSHQWNPFFARLNLNFDRMVEPLSRYEFPSLPSMKFIKGRTEKVEYDPNYRENQIRNNDYVDSEDESIGMDLEIWQASAGTEGIDNGKGGKRERDGREREEGNGVLEREESEGVMNTGQRGNKDYARKNHVPYFYARKRLKEALVEHYRSIALVKSYRSMNRTAIRKIVKKYDKATNSSMLKPVMSKVDQDSYFQTSVVLDQMMSRVEDLYLSFFTSEHADRKHGLERLKAVTYTLNSSEMRPASFHQNVFCVGLMVGVSLPFFISGLYHALIISPSNVVQYAERKYLLQLWGGFFLMVLAVFLVAINFWVYTIHKINYKFIFEFNLASALDFRQMFFLPSVALLFLSVFGWLSFMDFWPAHLPGRTWPLLYLVLMLGVCLWPGGSLFASSREWIQIALWRIVCSGFYPVEFRDFYIGDILCSLTYSIGNLAFFLCLYSVQWKHILGGVAGMEPIPASSAKCGSSNSHSMGFLTALPSIWRFLQCLRRFMDSGDAFPHLANMLKYLVGAIYYCFLSLWRIHRTRSYRAVFITFASVNSVFCALWDIIMDWSLGQTNSVHWLLRDNLFLGSPAWYYTAIVVDVVLRFQWIFYAFFSSQIQQSAVTSFCIALAEILRRFVWMFFRMENEHCTNVYLFRASRENSLPYPTGSRVEHAISRLVDLKYRDQPVSQVHSGSDESQAVDEQNQQGDQQVSSGGPPAYSTGVSRPSMAQVASEVMRRKSTFQTISEALNKAHIRDFQRKKLNIQEDSDDDDDDEPDTAERESRGQVHSDRDSRE